MAALNIIEKTSFEVAKLKPTRYGSGAIRLHFPDGSETTVYHGWDRLHQIAESGSVRFIVGESYTSPMTARDTRREISRTVAEGDFLHEIDMKEFISAPPIREITLIWE